MAIMAKLFIGPSTVLGTGDIKRLENSLCPQGTENHKQTVAVQFSGNTKEAVVHSAWRRARGGLPQEVVLELGPEG